MKVLAPGAYASKILAEELVLSVVLAAIVVAPIWAAVRIEFVFTACGRVVPIPTAPVVVRNIEEVAVRTVPAPA